MTGLAFMSSTCPEGTFEQMVDAGGEVRLRGGRPARGVGAQPRAGAGLDPGRPPGGPHLRHRAERPDQLRRHARGPPGPGHGGGAGRRRRPGAALRRAGRRPGGPHCPRLRGQPPGGAHHGLELRPATAEALGRPRRGGRPLRGHPCLEVHDQHNNPADVPGSWSTPAAATPASSGTPPTTCAWGSRWTTPTPSCAPGCATCTCKTGPRGPPGGPAIGGGSSSPSGRGTGTWRGSSSCSEGGTASRATAPTSGSSSATPSRPGRLPPGASRHLHAWRDAPPRGRGVRAPEAHTTPEVPLRPLEDVEMLETFTRETFVPPPGGDPPPGSGRGQRPGADPDGGQPDLSQKPRWCARAAGGPAQSAVRRGGRAKEALRILHRQPAHGGLVPPRRPQGGEEVREQVGVAPLGLAESSRLPPAGGPARQPTTSWESCRRWAKPASRDAPHEVDEQGVRAPADGVVLQPGPRRRARRCSSKSGSAWACTGRSAPVAPAPSRTSSCCWKAPRRGSG